MTDLRKLETGLVLMRYKRLYRCTVKLKEAGSNIDVASSEVQLTKSEAARQKNLCKHIDYLLADLHRQSAAIEEEIERRSKTDEP